MPFPLVLSLMSQNANTIALYTLGVLDRTWEHPTICYKNLLLTEVPHVLARYWQGPKSQLNTAVSKQFWWGSIILWTTTTTIIIIIPRCTHLASFSNWHSNQCRLVFHGSIHQTLTWPLKASSLLPKDTWSKDQLVKLGSGVWTARAALSFEHFCEMEHPWISWISTI